jgi:hypothetical protein
VSEWCCNCRFWRERETKPGIGNCHRNPPVICVEAWLVQNKNDSLDLTIRDVIDGLWPITVDSDWCGEWSAIKA